MKKYLFLLFYLLPFTGYSQHIRHFIFFSRDRHLLQDSAFYNNPGVAGAQVTYPWRKLEPRKDVYDFSEIESDVLFLASKGKKLFMQLQDVTFDSTINAVPAYLLTDPVYSGGQAAQYGITKEGKAIKAGWVMRRWDDAVLRRFHLLIEKLAERFDGRIEGINLAETAVDFPKVEGLVPQGFTPEAYLEGVKKNMRAVKQYFRQSTGLLYANFMPYDSRTDLVALYDYAVKINMGMGGPDIKVYREAQMQNSYPLIRSLAGKVPTGVAVQEGNYSVIHPKTGKPVTEHDILDFATDYLKLDYIFWCTEAPYYKEKVLPLLTSLGR